MNVTRRHLSDLEFIAGSSGNPGGQQSMTGNNVGGTNDMGKCCPELKPVVTTHTVKTYDRSANYDIFATSLLHCCSGNYFI